MELNQATFDAYLKMSKETGIDPLELKFYPIVDIEDGLPIAYRSKLVIHSVILGDMDEPSYIEVSDKHRCSIELFKRNVIHVLKAYKQFLKRDRHIDFISIRCPAELIKRVDLYEMLHQLLEDNKWFEPAKLCLEFPSKIMLEDTELSKRVFLDMKLLGITTAINGCGNDNFLLSKLVSVTPNYVYLEKDTTSFAGSRNKPQLLSSMIDYIKAMGINTICEGVAENRKALMNTDAVGFYDINSEELDIYDAVMQKEDAYE